MNVFLPYALKTVYRHCLEGQYNAFSSKINGSCLTFFVETEKPQMYSISSCLPEARESPGIRKVALTNGMLSSHCVMSDPASFRVQESGLTEMVFTDSIPYSKKCDKVKQLSIADMFAETIRRVMSNESISSQYII